MIGRKEETAFPGEILPAPNVNLGGDFWVGYPGLTKRELFAAMAMQSILAAEHFKMPAEVTWQQLAVSAADALIAELAK